MPIEKVHFHEVGALDSIADIAGAAIGLDFARRRALPRQAGLRADLVTAWSSVPMDLCRYRRRPLAELLKGVPLSSSSIKAELTTPTGAAILTTVVNEWTDEPAMTIERIGQGAGRREFDDQPNLLRLFVGTRAEAKTSDWVWVLETNLDDVPAETVGYVYERLLAAGALDVFTIPIYMKKNRPAMLLTVLTSEAGVPAMEEILFRETMTLGIRKYRTSRSILPRRAETVATPWGPVRGKVAWFKQDQPVFSPEFEDCARVAREHGLPLRRVQEAAQQAYGKSPVAKSVPTP